MWKVIRMLLGATLVGCGDMVFVARDRDTLFVSLV